MTYEDLHEDPQYSIWTSETDDDWAASNHSRDMIVVGKLTLYSARFGIARLTRLHPEGGWFIKDGSNKIVPNDPATYPDPGEGGLRAPRRTLGRGSAN